MGEAWLGYAGCLMIELLRLHHVSFAVEDLAASRRFFGEVLGLEELERPAFAFPGAWYALGDRQLHLIQEAAPGEQAAADPARRISRSDHMALEVRDLRAVESTLDEAQLPYQRGGNESLGFSQLFCSDPDGHTIEFVRYST